MEEQKCIALAYFACHRAGSAAYSDYVDTTCYYLRLDLGTVTWSKAGAGGRGVLFAGLRVQSPPCAFIRMQPDEG